MRYNETMIIKAILTIIAGSIGFVLGFTITWWILCKLFGDENLTK